MDIRRNWLINGVLTFERLPEYILLYLILPCRRGDYSEAIDYERGSHLPHVNIGSSKSLLILLVKALIRMDSLVVMVSELPPGYIASIACRAYVFGIKPDRLG